MLNDNLKKWFSRTNINHDLPSSVSDAYTEKTTSGCFDQPDKTLTMTCDPGHMVRVLTAYYGHSESGQCSGQTRDCVMEPTDRESYSCVGQRVCEVNLPSGRWGPYMRACQRRSTYMQLHYECVPGTLGWAMG